MVVAVVSAFKMNGLMGSFLTHSGEKRWNRGKAINLDLLKWNLEGPHLIYNLLRNVSWPRRNHLRGKIGSEVPLFLLKIVFFGISLAEPVLR